MPRSRFLPRRPVVMSAHPGRSPGSRIVLLPAPSQPRGQWPFAGFVPDYSDGVAADLHRLPWRPIGGAHGREQRGEPSRPRGATQLARGPDPRERGRDQAFLSLSAYDTARPAAASDWMPYGGTGYRRPFFDSAARPSMTLGRKRGGIASSS